MKQGKWKTLVWIEVGLAKVLTCRTAVDPLEVVTSFPS